ncbi:uncharacterized protein LOC133822344 isoform X2 [Humulus lupulus]|nr:uncharacterized protein LOC133822344 isoform X2 [Humulus lupulus]
MSSRRRPLHTCGVSILTIAHRTIEVSQDAGEPLGSITKRVLKMSSFAIPYLNALQYQWLVFLTFIDDFILAAENTVERVFPPSKHVFNKIDDIVQVTETFPMKYDKAVTTFPTIIHQVPFLDWLLVHSISLLKLLITTLTYWGSQGTREKEIMVDTNCENHDNNQFVSMNVYDHTTKAHVHVDSENNTIKGEFPIHVPETPPKVETEIASVKVDEDDLKSTYKEVLEKNTTKDDKEHGKKEINVTKGGRKKATADKKDDKKDGDHNKDDPILDLFESGWQMRR